MKNFGIAIGAALFASIPATAADADWWLVSGGPGQSSVQFVDAASISKTGSKVSFDVSTYWGNGHNMQRKLTLDCHKNPSGDLYSDLKKFACGTEETRMSTALKVGTTDPDWLAKTVLAMPS